MIGDAGNEVQPKEIYISLRLRIQDYFLFPFLRVFKKGDEILARILTRFSRAVHFPAGTKPGGDSEDSLAGKGCLLQLCKHGLRYKASLNWPADNFFHKVGSLGIGRLNDFLPLCFQTFCGRSPALLTDQNPV